MSQIGRRLRPRLYGPAVLGVCLLPATSHAHAPIEGVNEIINGLLHPIITPSHLLILLGLGLWIGQRQPLDLKTPLLIFAPVSALALAGTTTGLITTVYSPILLALALAGGLLVATAKELPPLVIQLLTGGAALLIGLDSRVENGDTLAVIKTLTGIWIGLLIVLCDVAIYGSYATKRKWMQVGTRVLGSWIVAISMLVLAFVLRKPLAP